MQEEMFREWLNNEARLSPRPINDAVARCHRIERDLSLDLDEEFNNHRSQNVLDTMTYTADDAAAGVSAPGHIQINGNIRTGMASLKHAVKLYFEFRGQGR